MPTVTLVATGTPANLTGRAAAVAIDAATIAAWAAAAAGAGWVVRRRRRSLSPAAADAFAFGTLVAPTIVTLALQEASPRQATLGKSVVGLRVQSVHGQRLGVLHALARNAVKMAPWQIAHSAVFRMAAGSEHRAWQGLAVGAQLAVMGSALTVLRDPDNRSWHDRLTRTRVIAVPPAEA